MFWILGVALLLLAVMAGTADGAAVWGRWERRFEAIAPAAPETELTVEMTAPTGRRHAVAGFWDGGASWAVRYLPDEEGEWRFRTRSSPAVAGLDGETGAFVCRRAASENRFLRHGPVHVSKHGPYLEHADGAPFFWLADTVWTGPQLATTADWDRFLDDRVAKRFTGIQFVLTAPWRTAPADGEGQVSFTGSERIEIQPGYFQRMDARIDAINAKGLLAVPVMIWACVESDPGRTLPEDQAVRLARYLLARYGAHQVAWILPGDGHYEGETAERWRRIGRAVFAGAEHAPVTLHPCGMNWPFDAFRDEEWLDFLGYQSGHGDDSSTVAWIHSGPPARKWREAPSRPIINLEPPYEGHLAYQSKQPHSDYNVRRAAYLSLLSAPTAGLTYGGHGIWSWQTEPGLPRDHESTGEARPWHEAKDLPGALQMRHLAELFTSVPWWHLRPDPDLLARQPGGDDPIRFVAASVTEDRSFAVLYMPVGGELEIRAGTGLDNRRAEWFDPRTGERRMAPVPRPNTFRAPDSQDWVLVLREDDGQERS